MALLVQDVVKKHGDVTAVDGLSLEVEDGGIVVLLGPSGCGKTTLLRCVAGLERVNDGLIALHGETVASAGVHLPPERRKVGMVFQDYALWPHMRVIDIVAFSFGTRVRGARRKEVRGLAREFLDTVGLKGLEARYPAQLSGGQQQRVALARALAGGPHMLLMDEPLSALDRSLREDLRLEVHHRIKESGLACMYTTHDQEEAMALADTLQILMNGKVVERGDPASVHDDPRTDFGAEFLGASNRVDAVVTTQKEQRIWRATIGERWEADFRASADWKPRPGEPVRLRWYPESTRVAPVAGHAGESTPRNAWPAVVADRISLGGSWEVATRILDADVRARTTTEVAAGDSILLEVPPERLFGFAPGVDRPVSGQTEDT